MSKWNVWFGCVRIVKPKQCTGKSFLLLIKTTTFENWLVLQIKRSCMVDEQIFLLLTFRY